MGVAKYDGLVNPSKGHFNGRVREHEDVLEAPLRWRKPRRVFVNSMSDLFHPGVADGFIARVFDVMKRADRHVFQVLTKRPERAAELGDVLPWPPNVLIGTSVEDRRVVDRVAVLKEVPALVRFLSCEPLIGPVGDIDLDGVGWVIVGGESGPRARPMDRDWARDLRDQCVNAGVPYFFKQWGRFDMEGRAVGKKRSGRLLDGRTWDEHPAIAGFEDPSAVGIAEPPPLSDETWERIRFIIPGRDGAPGGTGFDNRAFLNGVRWKAWTGRPWRDLPEQFGRWNTVSVRVKRWSESGHWPRVCDMVDDPLLTRLVLG